MNEINKWIVTMLFGGMFVVMIIQLSVDHKQKAKIADQAGVIESYKVTEKHFNDLQEGLINGEGYTVTRQENTDVARYIIGSCVKKEIQMFVPVTDK